MDEIIDYVMETPGNTNPNVLRGMLNNSGGNLPPVTADDNGDVLTVVSGEWAKAAPSGGGVLVVTADNGVLDHTWQEVVNAGFAIYSSVSDNITTLVPLVAYGQSENSYNLEFVIGSGPGGYEAVFVASSADSYPALEQ